MNKDIRRQIWVEIIKAFGLVWIFINHITEQLFGNPLIANPSSGWPPLADRIAQLRPLDGFGLWNFPINVLRYFGWSGDQGVQLFLIASGFGLTWGLLNKQAGVPINVANYFKRRAERLYPMWWGIHIFFIGVWFVTGWGLSVFDSSTILSLLGIRITPNEMYSFSPAWWYIGLIIQLYIIYPLLWECLRKWGPKKLFLWSSISAFAIRGAGLLVFNNYLDAWSRGAIFITRLPEFIFGICLATWFFLKPEITIKRLRSPIAWLSVICLYILGICLSVTLLGMTFAPFCLGVAAFLFLFLLIDRLISILPPRSFTPWVWVGEHSYSLFLVHNPIILALVPYGIALSIPTAGRILFSIILTVALALLLQWSVHFMIASIPRVVKRFGIGRLLLAAGLLVVIVFSGLLSIEWLIRQYDPQEVLGWGERPSLQPDPIFGWRLKSSQIIHLRWESYDYFVTANSLGFPAPEYPILKNPDTFRILVTGDAFSSAEGVNTDQAWPRLLESELSAKMGGKKVEILNFAITGYGPNQYEATIRHFTPLYKPDLIIVEMFVNDFEDALTNTEDIQQSIGFDRPEPDSLVAIIRLEQQRRWIKLYLGEPIKEILKGEPRSEGYFLGNFKALERGHTEYENEGKEIVAQRLAQIQAIAGADSASLLVIMVPAPVQICGPDQLAYYPKHVDLTDSKKYDTELPQRMISELTTSLAIPFLDLRQPLAGNSKTCPYQPHNMHWTVGGHKLVADYLSDFLIKNGFVH